MDSSVSTTLLAGAPAVIAALLPRKWTYFAFGWMAFALALLILHSRPPVPLAAQGPLGPWDSWLWLSAGFAMAAFAVRFTVDAVRRTPSPRLDFDRRLLLSWVLPVGAVLAILMFHGLSETLAGFRPAWLAHALLIVAIGIGFAVLLMKFVKATEVPGWPMGLAFAFLIVLFILAGAAIDQAFRMSRRASTFADGAPYCVTTYDRSGRARPATSTFELSPLVMRSRGRHAARNEPWLVVQTRWGPVAHRWRTGYIFEIAGGPVACTPA